MVKKFLTILVFVVVAFNFSFGAEKKATKSKGSKSPSSKKTSAEIAGSAGSLGVGFILGAPIGATAKYYFSTKMALDAAAGWSLSQDAFRVHSDFLLHNEKLLSKAFGFPLVLSYGAGVKFVFANDFNIGVRIPVGVLHNFKKPSVDVFFELVPVILLTPDVDLDFDAAIGARYYFSLK